MTISRGVLLPNVVLQDFQPVQGGSPNPQDVFSLKHGQRGQVYRAFKQFTSPTNYEAVELGWIDGDGEFACRTKQVGNPATTFMFSSGGIFVLEAGPNSSIFFRIGVGQVVATISQGSFFGAANPEPKGSIMPNGDNTQDMGLIPEGFGSGRWRKFFAGTAYVLAGTNFQKLEILQNTELTAVANGVTTQASTITIPTNAVVLAVSSRVLTQPGGTATYVLKGTASLTQFSTSAAVSTTAGTTDPGTKSCPFYDAQTNETVTYTFNVATTNALGQIRTTIYYYLSTPPTS